MLHKLHFMLLTCIYKNSDFSLASSSEAISIDELGWIAP